MKLENDKITLKQALRLMMNTGFKKCEIWKLDDYLRVHSRTKQWRSHLIAARKMDILEDFGLPEEVAQRAVIMEGTQKVNRKNLAFLGRPVFSGTVEKLSNQVQIWENMVYRVYFKGPFRNTLIVVIE